LLLLSYAELRTLDTRVTDLVRSLAIEHACDPKKFKPNPPNTEIVSLHGEQERAS
jgi:hypothetical protein